MAKEFVPCIPKHLPAEQAWEAARVAVEINPANAPAVEQMMAILGVALMPTPTFLAVLTTKYWGVGGVKLSVSFMDNPTVACRNKILAHMNAWGEHCNAVFSWSQSQGQVRIDRRQQGYWSYLGTDILQIPTSQATMNLSRFTENTPDAEYRRVVRHETGHTMGFPHEQQLPQIVALLDVEKTIAWGRSALGWDEQMVRSQILTPLNPNTLRMTANADVNGIMCYALPRAITKNNQDITGGNDIDAIDGAFSNVLYPKVDQPPPPPPPPPNGVSDFDLSMSIASKTVSIRLPAGWTVTRKPAQQTGESMSQEHDYKHMATLADELEATLPARAPDDSGAIALGEVFTSALALAAALRAGDWKAVALALRDVLNAVFGGNGGTIQFQAPGVDMGKLTSVIAKIS